ncbi:MAG: helix-turn-helix transcriptional regulator, partial [Halorhabdus sp.]
NFGLREGSMVHVKDAFTGPNGLWLQGLSADQRLVIAVPEAFDITSAPKGYTNRTIRWDGPTDFEPADFEITYDVNPSEATTPAPTTTRSTTQSQTSSNVSPTPSNAASTRTTNVGPTQGGGIPPAVIVAVVVAVAAVGVFLLRNGGDLSLPETTDDADGAVETPPDDHATDAAANASNVDDESTPATEESTPATDDAAPIDRELLSDEEYVEALIERNGGRMKQANIVSETGWSNAKVSQLLSAMAEEGRVEKLRIGRENLISFPDDEAEE